MFKFFKNDIEDVVHGKKFKVYKPYQWAWEFLRRNLLYHIFQPKCLAVYDAMYEQQCEKLGAGTPLEKVERETQKEFRKTEAFKELNEVWGLVYPEDPFKSGFEIEPTIWDNCYLKDELNFDTDLAEENPERYTVVVLDRKKPREIQKILVDEYLKETECVEHTSNVVPHSFEIALDVYDAYIGYYIVHKKYPTYQQISRICWPDEWRNKVDNETHRKRTTGDDKKQLEDRVTDPLARAKKNIEGREYFKILLWRPNLKKGVEEDQEPPDPLKQTFLPLEELTDYFPEIKERLEGKKE